MKIGTVRPEEARKTQKLEDAIPGSIRAQVNKAIEPGADYDPTCIFCQNGEEPGHDH